MRSREAWASAALVFLAAVAVRAWAATIITFPRPEDTAYYVGVARHLVEGRGLVSDAIWSFATPPLEFPRPAFEVWLPLPSFLAALPMVLFGTSFAVAQWPTIVVGGIVAVLAWRLAAEVAADRRLPPGRARTLALGTGLSSAVFMPLVLHSVLPDSTMLFGALVLAACLLGARILRSPVEVPAGPSGLRVRLGLNDPRVIVLGVILGLAAMTRNEAIWLALAWALVTWLGGRRGVLAELGGGLAGGLGGRPAGISGPGGLAELGGVAGHGGGLSQQRRVSLIVGAAIPAIIVFIPWAVRDWLAFGSPFPGQALANALSLDGRDIFAWWETPTLARYLDAGPATLVGLRVEGFVHNLVNVLLLLGIPISAIGLLALPWTATGWSFGSRLSGVSLPSLPSLPSRSAGSAGSAGSAEPPAPTIIVLAEPRRPVDGPLAWPPGTLGEPAAGRPAGAAPPPLAPPPRPPSVPDWPAADLPVARQAERPPAWMARPERLEPIDLPGTMPGALTLLVVFAVLTFAATTLLFPVATTWGTVLHASAAIQVLLLLSALLALDRILAEIGRRRAWTRPVAWLGPLLGVAAGALFTAVLLPGFGRDGDGVRARFEALPAALEAAGVPIEVRGAPVITDFPIYLAEVTGANALALPDEPPDSVVDLAARFPGTRLLIVAADNEGIWPEAALADARGLACFESVPVDLDGLVVYRILCP